MSPVAKAPVKEDVWIPTVCNMCYNNCTIQLHRVDGVVVKVTGVPDAPPNHGKICAKGNSQIQSVYSPHRMLHPMIRTNPKKGLDEDPGWKQISWEEAMSLMTEKLKAVHADDPRKLLILSWDGQSYLPLRAFTSGFGSNNYSAGSAGYFCGNGIHPVSYSINGSIDLAIDLHHNKYCLQFGCQYGFVAMSHAMAAAREMADGRQNGMKLVVVDPVLSNAAGKADEWVPIRPGTDAALALGMINQLINHLDLYDKEFLQKWTNSTYLVGPDEFYLRDAASDKPLVWNSKTNRAEAFDVCPPLDAALDGDFRANDVPCRPSFGVFRRHVAKYTPQKVEEITSVPAANVVRMAQEFGEAAQIGSTIVIDGETLPYRPAVAFWYRGVSQHKHSMHNGFAIALLNVMVGAVDVPGGLLNANAAGPFGFPAEGPDGLITRGNPYSHMRPQWPPQAVGRPQTLELLELFPLSVYARAMPWLAVLEPEKYQIPYMPEAVIHCRDNIVMTSADPVRVVEALAKVPFMVSFVDFMNETAAIADLVLPDAHHLERLCAYATDPYCTFYATPQHDEEWWFAWQQEVVPPAGESKYWIEVLFDLAERVGCLGDVYMAFNGLGYFKEPFLLDPDQTYTWEQICDRWARSRCGPEIGLEYFKKHGYYKFSKRTVKESFPRAFHNARIPIYFEHFKKAGQKVKAVIDEMGLKHWEIDDYNTLIDWKPCHPHHQNDGSLWVVNTKMPFYAHTISAENPLLNDLSDRNTHVFAVGINPVTAARLGVQAGDRIALETNWGKRIEGIADIRQGVHPECVVCPGIMGRKITGDPRIRGKGIHFNSLIKYTDDNVDYTSAALDACVRVQVTKVAAAR